MTYWPFWLGAIALAAVVLLHWLMTGRPFGVSGAFAKVVSAADESRVLKSEREALANAESFQAAVGRRPSDALVTLHQHKCSRRNHSGDS